MYHKAHQSQKIIRKMQRAFYATYAKIFPAKWTNCCMWLTCLLQKRELQCIFSPTKARKSHTSRSARDRHAGYAQRRASNIPSASPVEAHMNNADNNIAVAAPTPISTHARNTSGSAQTMLTNQVASESTNRKWDKDLYVDRILFALEPTGTPEEVRSRYPAGCYSVSRQTVNEHGQCLLRGL
jgi:hypothetical protein